MSDGTSVDSDACTFSAARMAVIKKRIKNSSWQSMYINYMKRIPSNRAFRFIASKFILISALVAVTWVMTPRGACGRAGDGNCGGLEEWFGVNGVVEATDEADVSPEGVGVDVGPKLGDIDGGPDVQSLRGSV